MEKKSYTITIAAPIYPPEIGGPAYYAEMLASGFIHDGIRVQVVTYGNLKKLPTGIRHIAYFFKIIPRVLTSRYVLALDTFSAALPALLAAKLFGKKTIIRVGGDFLWEEYVERVKKPILLSEFYNHDNIRFSTYTSKEKIIFKLTKFTLSLADRIAFSTIWQRTIMQVPYGFDMGKTAIIENEYAVRKKRNVIPKQRVILSPSRDRFLKNKTGLAEAFAETKNRFSDISLDTGTSSRERLLDRIQESYCLIVPSFSEVSPNIVLDAISLGVPVIAPLDCGLHNRLESCVMWVDTKNTAAIAEAIERLMDAQTYTDYMNRIAAFSFVRTENDIVREFEKICENI